MESTDFKTGWSTKAWIEVKAISTYAFFSDFKCCNSGKKLEKECLFVSRINFKHRGNEKDELYYYNRDSAPEEYASVWDEWDSKKEDQKQLIRGIVEQYNLQVSVK